MEFLSKSLEETGKIAVNFAKATLAKFDSSGQATVVGFYGELGSGKTTFMKYLAEALGVKEAIQSPTFVIEKIYKLQSQHFKYLIHIDAYRLDAGEDLLKLGWAEIVADPKNLICLEWPERVAEILPPHIVLKFEHVSENERKISVA